MSTRATRWYAAAAFFGAALCLTLAVHAEKPATAKEKCSISVNWRERLDTLQQQYPQHADLIAALRAKRTELQSQGGQLRAALEAKRQKDLKPETAHLTLPPGQRRKQLKKDNPELSPLIDKVHQLREDVKGLESELKSRIEKK